MTTTDRRTRLSVLQHIEVASPDGQPVGDWVEQQRVWGQVRHRGGTEQLQAGAVVSGLRATVRVHTRAFAWSPALRLRDGGTVYDVQAVLPYSPEPGMTELQCQVLT